MRIAYDCLCAVDTNKSSLEVGLDTPEERIQIKEKKDEKKRPVARNEVQG